MKVKQDTPQVQQGFEISLEPERCLCKVAIKSGWRREDTRRFGRAVKQHMKALGLAGQQWYALIDMTGSAPQSQDVLGLIDRGLAPLNCKRVAVLAHHATPLFQPAACTQKSKKCIYSYFWSSEEQAIRWLLDEESVPACVPVVSEVDGIGEWRK